MEHGYLGQPTTVNNVETYCAAARTCFERCSQAGSAVGTAKSTGTKIHSVSGDCARPGIYEYPFGTKINQYPRGLRCGSIPRRCRWADRPGCASRAFEFGRRTAFEDVPTAGAFMIFDRSRDMFEVARSFAQFFAHESCGFCTPCRVGTALVVKSMDKTRRRSRLASRHRVAVRTQRSDAHRDPLRSGRPACNALRDTIARFRPAYERRLKSLHFEPGFDLDAELSVARRMTGRDDPAAHLKETP